MAFLLPLLLIFEEKLKNNGCGGLKNAAAGKILEKLWCFENGRNPNLLSLFCDNEPAAGFERRRGKGAQRIVGDNVARFV